MLGDKRFLRTIQLSNLLSFHHMEEPIEANSLNVLIGPNGSGKSNFIEAIGLLQAVPKDLVEPVREGGGISEWLWKGSEKTPIVEIDVTVDYPGGIMPLRHRLSFTMVGQRFEVVDEAIENERPQSETQDEVYFFYRYQGGRPVLKVSSSLIPLAPPGYEEEQPGRKPESNKNLLALAAPSDHPVFRYRRTERSLPRAELAADQSILSQRKDPDQYPEITYLGNEYSKIRLYREWNLGRYTPPRKPQQADLPEDFLEPDARNLGLVLNDLEHHGTKKVLLEKLGVFSDAISDYSTKIRGGTVQIFLHEKGLNQPIPATRLSDGTLRYLCLLTLLCHPEPPPVLCIEEPELGLHPDILPTIAELLIDASHRCQLFVTTHSDILIDSLSKVPEAVIVCEKREGATSLRRLKAEDLSEWLEKYSLGTLWRRGDLGGNRW